MTKHYTVALNIIVHWLSQCVWLVRRMNKTNRAMIWKHLRANHLTNGLLSRLHSGDRRTYLTKKCHTSALNYMCYLPSYSFKAICATQHRASKNTSVFISLTERETPLNVMCGLRCLLSLAVYSEACCRLTAAVSELVLLLWGGSGKHLWSIFAKHCNSGKLLLANTSNSLRECWPPATARGSRGTNYLAKQP